MAKEIERKYLVKDLSFKQLSKGVLYKQGYLSTDPKATVRIRVIGQQAFIAIKGADNGISRIEYEYEIPFDDADKMIGELCHQPIIEKYRYKIEYKGFVWEIDEFLGDNEGLVVAEIELSREDEEFMKPDFVGDEVTHDYRYRNSNLVDNPYKSWNNKTGEY
ncbi:CYTH domain-containing protein [Petroclostridium sp. X23]|uniref:CYTH domain-containing protein n=1 Tax=Petroclostridium sp. X23 TaxID=3045146 RepID=UPI0024ACA8C1|nr:CYTH domain-containing protein [Petroclostridium sp. X23]WHH57806.1 CYTH domain-containing protein [Petroclostridium sp. X23]